MRDGSGCLANNEKFFAAIPHNREETATTSAIHRVVHEKFEAYFLRVTDWQGGYRDHMEKILAPTDLSEMSLPPVRYALELGLELDAEVIIYNVIGEEGMWFGKDDPLNPATAFVPRQRERLGEFVRKNFADGVGKVKLSESVEAGIPHLLIVTKAEEENAELIVMSTHGRTGIEQIMLGSVTAQVVARASCPVLSIRPGRKQTAQ